MRPKREWIRNPRNEIVKSSDYENKKGDLVIAPTFAALTAAILKIERQILIVMSTPAGRFSLRSSSTVFAVGSMMSSKRLWVRISNCSMDFLST
jgi:hypothetical protein